MQFWQPLRALARLPRVHLRARGRYACTMPVLPAHPRTSLMWNSFQPRHFSSAAGAEWSDYGVSSAIIERLKDMGANQPFPVQQETFEHVSNGRDVLVQAQTGTGKTLAFGLPIIEMLRNNPANQKGRVRAIIIVPTRELAIQVNAELSSLSKDISFACIYGGAATGPQQRLLAKGVDVVVGTPGRMKDFIQSKTLDISAIEACVLDEADTMLDYGFQDDVDEILENAPHKKQMMLFSATVPTWVQRLTAKYLDNPISVALVDRATNQTPKDIEHLAIRLSPQLRATALRAILPVYSRARAMVFVKTKKLCDEISASLSQQMSARGLHGDMSQIQREVIMNAFREGSVKVLVATDVAARGVDVKGVDCVVHVDTDLDPDRYIHRAGRCGRAGSKGVSIITYTPNQDKDVQLIKRRLKVPLKTVNIPTREDVIRCHIERAGDTLEEVDATDRDNYLSHARQILFPKEGETAEEALERSAAVMAAIFHTLTGGTNVKASIMSGIEGMQCIILRAPGLHRRGAYYAIKQLAGSNAKIGATAELRDGSGVAVDVPLDIAQLAMEEQRCGELEVVTGMRRITAEIPMELPDLDSEEEERGGGRRRGGRDGGRRGRSNSGRSFSGFRRDGVKRSSRSHSDQGFGGGRHSERSEHRRGRGGRDRDSFGNGTRRQRVPRYSLSDWD